jgi:DNA-binding beta-propeller fold protein YncE
MRTILRCANLSGMSRLGTVVSGVCAVGLGIACNTPDAGAQSAGTSVAVPGCSTAVAAAPSLGGVDTSFVSVLGAPFGIAIDHSSNYAFVASQTGSILEYSIRSSIPHLVQIDTFGTPEPHQAPIGGTSPAGLALTPNGRYLVAAARSGAIVVNVNRLENKGSPSSSWTVGTLESSGSGAIEAAVSPDGEFVFVSLEDSHELAVFNLKRALARGFGTSDLIGTVPLGVSPVGVVISPNGRYLYATSESSSAGQTEGTLTTIDLKRAERSPAHSIISTVVAGCSPVRVAATNMSVFVTARESDALLEFSAHDLVSNPNAALMEDLQIGEGPVDLALVDNNHTLVVADSDRFGAPGAHPDLAVVTVTSRGSLVLAGYVGSGVFPRDMTLSPNGQTLLVSNFGSGQLEAVKVSNVP